MKRALQCLILNLSYSLDRVLEIEIALIEYVLSCDQEREEKACHLKLVKPVEPLAGQAQPEE
jgi:hypothetical protein